MENDYQQFVPNVHFEQIRIKDLVSNQAYQRNLSITHINRTAAHFDIYQINPVKVSRRDGINYVFNGQHTIEIVAQISGSRETPVWCMIYDDLEYKHEADIFANQKLFDKPLSPYEIFMAHVEAGNDKQLFIKSLVESYNLTLSPTKTVGSITAIATLEKIYDKYGFSMLDHVLRIIIETWEGANLSFSANMLNAIAKLFFTYGDKLKDNIFIDKLSRVSIKELTRTAKERRPGSMGFSEAILIYYNKKLHNPLSFEALYTYKAAKKSMPPLKYQEDIDEVPFIEVENVG
jgi:hypothetical protein